MAAPSRPAESEPASDPLTERDAARAREPEDPLGWAGAPLTDKVRIFSVAGEGAFGVVYRALHEGFGEPVAVKCLRFAADLGEPERRALIQSFQGEARLLHRLSRRSAHVVQALDVGAATSPTGIWSPYIVMEWLEGCSLEQDLASRAARGEPPRSVDETLDLLAPAVEALCLAHEEHICHRDLKPANLFLTRAGTGGAEGLKVLDFGIAKALEVTASITHAFQNTARVNRIDAAMVTSPTVPEAAVPVHAFTPRYGAPEQFSVQWGATGPWTDVFQMALVIVEVATGKAALSGRDLLQLYVASSDARRRPGLSSRGAAVSDEIEALIQRALDVDPARRFRSMGDFAAALARARSAGKRGSLGALSESPGVAAGLGENRLLTVLFAEPELALGPAEAGGSGAKEGASSEEHAEQMRRVVEILEGCARARGGRSEALAGGGVMAVWGLPRAGDADAELAVQAALDMREALSKGALSGGGSRPELRAGIATGRVLVTPGAGPPSGRAVSLAAHLTRHAPAGAVLVSRDTHRQVSGRFAIEAFSSGELLQNVFCVTGPAVRGPALEAGAFFGLATRLVGRKAEIARLTDLWETAEEESRPVLAVIAGPSGSGRSRLLAELSALAAESQEPCTVLAAQGSPRGVGESHGLVRALLSGAFHVHPDDPREAVLRKLRRGLRKILSETASMTGTLGEEESLDLDAVEAELFGGLAETLEDVAALWAPRSSAPAAPPLVLGADDAATPADPRLRAAFARLLRTLAARGPVLVLCDDVEWADRASLSLLADLPLRVPTSPVLFVCSATPELFERDPPFGESIPGFVRLDLAPLAQRHIEEMVRDRLRKVDGLRAEVVSRIAARADRLPLAVTELLHLLVDTGAIEVRGEGAWALHEEAIEETALPATVVGLAQARFDRLEAPMREVLSRAAVIGKTFWASALADAPGAEALIERLCDRQILKVAATSMFPGERQIVFAESSLHEVAYATSSAAARREMHARAASWLEGRAGDAEASLLAWHHEQAGAKERAASEHVRAAAHAEALGQAALALHHLERAAAIHAAAEGPSRGVPGLGGADSMGMFDGRERRVASFQDRALVLLRLGDALRFAGRNDEATEAYARARARLVRAERRAHDVFDAREIAVWEARLDCRRAAILKVQGSTPEARGLVEGAIARATEAGAEGETLSMWAMLAVLHRRMRDPLACRRTALSGLRVARRATLRDGRFRDDLSRLFLALAASFYTEGKMVRAERTYRQASRCVNAEESPHTLGLCLNGIAGTRLARGDLSGAKEALLASFKLKERAGDLHQLAIAHNNLAEIRLRLGEREAALDHARRAVAIGERIGAASDVPDMHRNLAEISLASGDRAAAMEACERAMRGAAVGGGRVYLADVGLCSARVAKAITGDVEATEDLRARGRDLARSVLSFVDESFTEERLRGAAAECRALAQEALEVCP